MPPLDALSPQPLKPYPCARRRPPTPRCPKTGRMKGRNSRRVGLSSSHISGGAVSRRFCPHAFGDLQVLKTARLPHWELVSASTCLSPPPASTDGGDARHREPGRPNAAQVAEAQGHRGGGGGELGGWRRGGGAPPPAPPQLSHTSTHVPCASVTPHLRTRMGWRRRHAVCKQHISHHQRRTAHLRSAANLPVSRSRSQPTARLCYGRPLRTS